MPAEREVTNEMQRPQSIPPLWDRLEKWHKVLVVLIGAAVSTFGAGVAAQRARSSVVLAGPQHEIDERQDQQIHAVLDDAGRMHVSLDDLHDEVRGMRTDLRYFDPRFRGGNLPALAEEPPRPSPRPIPTSTLDPSMGLLLPSPTPTPPGP